MYALWRPTPAVARRAAGKGAADARAHLLQVRRRQSRRQPQAEYRRRPGLLQQAGGHQTAGDGDRRRANGARRCRHGLPVCSGWNARVYMVKVSYHQKPYRRLLMQTWGATVHASPERPHRVRTQVLGRRSRLPRQPGHRHQRGDRETPSNVPARNIPSAACSTMSACTRPSSARKPSSRWRWPAKSRTW